MNPRADSDRLLRVLAPLRLPLPREALLESGLVSADAVADGLRSGRLVLDETGCIRVNPLQPGPRVPLDVPHERRQLLEAALKLHPERLELGVEWVVRARVSSPEAARQRAERMCRHALTGGSARQLVKVWMEREAVETFLELCRREVLCCFIEAGWARSVAAVLRPEEAGLRARVAHAERRFEDAARILAPVRSAEACLVRARLALAQDDAAGAQAAFEAFAGQSATFAQELECALLRHRRAVVVADSRARDRAASALEALAAADGDPHLRAHVVGGVIRSAMVMGDVPTAETHLRTLQTVAGPRPAPGIAGLIRYSNALLGILTGNHPRLAASLQEDPGDALSPGETRWKLLSAIELALRGQVRAALALMRSLPMHSLRLEFCLLLGAFEEAREIVSALEGAGGGPMSVLASQLRRLQGRHTRPIPAESPYHQVFLYRSLLNASLLMDSEDYAGAERICLAAQERVERYHLWEPGVQVWLLRADLAARQGRVDDALKLLERADAHECHPLGFNANLVAAARAVLSEAMPSRSMVSRMVEQGDYRSLVLLAEARVPMPPGAARVLGRLPGAARALAARRFRVAVSDSAILLQLDGQWFQLPEGERVSLVRYGSTRRILVALAETRLSRPGARMTAAELIQAGWPDSQILPEAAQSRLYTAIRKLRKLGLGAVLQTTSDGYRLAPDVPLVRVGESES